MELNGFGEKSEKNGLDNPTYQAPVHIAEGSTGTQESSSITTEDVTDSSLQQSHCGDVENQSFLEKKLDVLKEHLKKYRSWISLVLRLVLAAGFVAVVIAACVVDFGRALGLLVLALAAVFFLLWDWLMGRYGGRVWDGLEPARRLFDRCWVWIRWVVCALALVGLVCWLVLDTARQGPRGLVSFAGLLCFLLIMLLFSKYPFRVSWRTVLAGVGLQFLIGLVILRTQAGLTAVKWLGRQVQVFLSYTDAGSNFVFGEKLADHVFAFKVLPIVVFFSTIISMLYYLGFMQWLISKVGFFMQVVMGTSPTESTVAAGNIFVGMSESPLLIRPYLTQLTMSELHAVMTAGFSTIAGSVLGAYISFGIAPSHLLTASMMSAPASLVISKIFWPETETPKVTDKGDIKLEKGAGSNLLEAASHGASSSVVLVANIAVNLIAFLALLSFINAVLSWLGGMFEYPQLSFSIICSYVLRPLPYLMGVAWEDAFIVAELIGLKTFFNEFVAYERLAKLIKMREHGDAEYVDGVKQYLSVHSETIATFALCGFANFSSLGMSIGGLSAMAPERRSDISKCGFRALIAGTISCFMTACIAGILYMPELQCSEPLERHFNSTSAANSTQILTCCTHLYNSVTVLSPSNVSLSGGYSMASLLGCCSLLPTTRFNCSLLTP